MVLGAVILCWCLPLGERKEGEGDAPILRGTIRFSETRFSRKTRPWFYPAAEREASERIYPDLKTAQPLGESLHLAVEAPSTVELQVTVRCVGLTRGPVVEKNHKLAHSLAQGWFIDPAAIGFPSNIFSYSNCVVYVELDRFCVSIYDCTRLGPHSEKRDHSKPWEAIGDSQNKNNTI